MDVRGCLCSAPPATPRSRAPGAAGRLRRGPRRRGGGRAAQATIEFAVVFTLFLLMLFAIVDAWIWTIESNAADAAVEQGIGVALAAPPASPTSVTNDTAGVYPYALSLIREPMLGTSVDQWNPPPGWPAGTCPTADDVANAVGVGHVDVCAVNDGAGHVTVVVAGYGLSFIPPGLSLFELRPWGLPIYQSASVSIGTYSP